MHIICEGVIATRQGSPCGSALVPLRYAAVINQKIGKIEFINEMLYKGMPKRYKVFITKVNYEVIFKVKYTCYKIITTYRVVQMEGSPA